MGWQVVQHECDEHRKIAAEATQHAQTVTAKAKETLAQNNNSQTEQVMRGLDA